MSRISTHDFGNWSAGAPFLWNTPSTNTPFFPLHVMKKFGCSKKISMCRLDIKLESPILTSTSPLELFRPMVIRFCRTMYSNSRPCSLAIAVPDFHCILDGLGDVDFRANNAQASLSFDPEWTDITWIETYPIIWAFVDWNFTQKWKTKRASNFSWLDRKSKQKHTQAGTQMDCLPTIQT
jgi:hypothetical protein